MANKTYPDVSQFAPMVVVSHTAVTAEATANKVVLDMPRVITSAIAQIQAASTGVVNAAGLAVKVVAEVGSAPCKVEVAATSITAGDIVRVIAW